MKIIQLEQKVPTLIHSVLNFIGYISATCSSSGFNVKINGACHNAYFDYLPTTNWYAGNTASESSCKFTTSGSNYELSGRDWRTSRELTITSGFYWLRCQLGSYTLRTDAEIRQALDTNCTIYNRTCNYLSDGQIFYIEDEKWNPISSTSTADKFTVGDIVWTCEKSTFDMTSSRVEMVSLE